MTPTTIGATCIDTSLLHGEAVQTFLERELKEDSSKVHFLARHYASPGLLCGDPLAVSGFTVETIEPEDLVEFFLMHVLGPAWIREGARVSLTSTDGRRTRGRHFFRTKARLVDGQGRCPFVVIRLRPGTGMADPGPESYVAGVTSILDASGIPYAVERSMMIGEWPIWIFFDQPVEQERAVAFMKELEALFDAHGCHDPEKVILPLLMKDQQPLFVPFQFFGVGRFGLLYRYEGGRLVPADPGTIATYNLDELTLVRAGGAGGHHVVADARVDHGREEDDHEDDQGDHAEQVVQDLHNHREGDQSLLLPTWERFIAVWARSFGTKAVRAGELVRIMDLTGVAVPVPGLVPGDSAQRQAILLGRTMLQCLCGQTLGGYRVEGTQSGNSRVFRLLPT